MRPTPIRQIQPSPDELLAQVRRQIRLDFSSGDLYWLPRPREDFRTQRAYVVFRNKFEGRRADLGTYPMNGYRRVRMSLGASNFTVSAHRVVFALVHGRWPTHEIDHIDRCRTNNAPSNLRDVPHTVNLRNRGARGASRAGLNDLHQGARCA